MALNTRQTFGATNGNAEPSWAGERNQRCGIPDEKRSSSLLPPGLRTCPMCGNTALVWLKKCCVFLFGTKLQPFHPWRLGPRGMKEVLSVLALEGTFEKTAFLKGTVF